MLGFDQYLVTCLFLAFKQPSQPQRPWAETPVTLLYQFYLVKIINPVYMQWLREMVPLPGQNAVGFCTQIMRNGYKREITNFALRYLLFTSSQLTGQYH